MTSFPLLLAYPTSQLEYCSNAVPRTTITQKRRPFLGLQKNKIIYTLYLTIPGLYNTATIFSQPFTFSSVSSRINAISVIDILLLSFIAIFLLSSTFPSALPSAFPFANPFFMPFARIGSHTVCFR